MSTVQVDNYINNLPEEKSVVLTKIREMIKEMYPNVEESFGYQMPSFKEKKVFVYYAAFSKHIGIYPPLNNEFLFEKTKQYRNEKGNLRFKLSEEIPYDLIKEVVIELYKYYNK